MKKSSFTDLTDALPSSSTSTTRSPRVTPAVVPAPARTPSPGTTALEVDHERALTHLLARSDDETNGGGRGDEDGQPPLTYLQAFFILEHFFRASGCDQARLRAFLERLSSRGLVDFDAVAKHAPQIHRFREDFLRALVTSSEAVHGTQRRTALFLARQQPIWPADEGALVAAVAAGASAARRNESPSVFSRDYEEIEALGKGAFGSVVKARRHLDGVIYAIKRIPFSVPIAPPLLADSGEQRIGPVAKATLRRVLREARTLARLDHPNVIRYFSSWIEQAEDRETGNSARSKKREERDDVTVEDGDDDEEEEETEFRRPSERYVDAGWSGEDEDSEETDLEEEHATESSDDDEEETHDCCPCDESGLHICFGDPENGPHPNDDGDETRTHSAKCEEYGGSDRTSGAGETRRSETGTTATEEELPSRNSKALVVYTPPQQLLGLLVGASGDPPVLVTKKRRFTLFVQTQCCGGSTLREWLDKPCRKAANHAESFEIFSAIVSGLVHIHSRGIVHRDLKPSNIFLDEIELRSSGGGTKRSRVVKIGDFGLAKELVTMNEEDREESTGDTEEAPRVTCDHHTRGVGTVPYSSPEQISRSLYSEKTDIFSLGVILFELYHPAFTTLSERARAIAALRESGEFPPEMEALFPEQCTLVRQLTRVDPRERPSADEIVACPLFKSLESSAMTQSLAGPASPRSPQASTGSPSLTPSPSLEQAEMELRRLREILESKERQIALKKKSTSPAPPPSLTSSAPQQDPK